MLDEKVKRELDLKLVRGEITQEHYDQLIYRLGANSTSTSLGKTPFVTLDSGFSVRDLALGSLLRGRYEILGDPKRGGMGAVYRARDGELDRMVALKVLPWEVGSNPEAYDLLRKEANTAMSLHHERIMAVHGLDKDGETAFLVMELIEGPTLSKKLITEGPMPPREVIRIGIECCEALAHAHGKKVLHRDIKPHNIMLTADDHVKLCDFGLATELRSSLSRVSGKHVSGTLLYMPPEQLDAEPLDERADVYALCMTLYECLAGKHPWAGNPDVSYLVRNGKLKPLPGVPSGLIDLVLLGVSKERTKRPLSAKVLLEHLKVLRDTGGEALGKTSVYLESITSDSSGPDHGFPESPPSHSDRNEPVIRRKTLSSSDSLQSTSHSHLHRTVGTIILILICLFFVSVLATKVSQRDTSKEVSTPPGMVLIRGGSFLMGCSPEDSGCWEDEKPAHQKNVGSFHMDITEVTQSQYHQVMGTNPSHFSGCENCPVESVGWNQARDYCSQVGKRLPTEAEWEYAARGGKPGARYGDVDEIAWHKENSGSRTHPVGEKEKNPYGLSDMLGNVWEWTADSWKDNYIEMLGFEKYTPNAFSRIISPAWASDGSEGAQLVAARGGSWKHKSKYVRSSNRFKRSSVKRDNAGGFRCVK